MSASAEASKLKPVHPSRCRYHTQCVAAGVYMFPDGRCERLTFQALFTGRHLQVPKPPPVCAGRRVCWRRHVTVCRHLGAVSKISIFRKSRHQVFSRNGYLGSTCRQECLFPPEIQSKTAYEVLICRTPYRRSVESIIEREQARAHSRAGRGPNRLFVT